MLFVRYLGLSFFLIIIAACGNSGYRFEEVKAGESTPIPLKFDSLYGTRDGDSVTAEARFSNAGDSAQINLVMVDTPNVATSVSLLGIVSGVQFCVTFQSLLLGFDFQVELPA